jgi:putative iron-dependent peroxidase
MFEDRTVASGEFLLGHVNEYGEIARCPDARWKIAGGKMAERPFGLNGSYLVVRQIEQAVEKFLDCERANPSAPRETVAGAAGAPPAQPSPVSVAPSVGEKMIGRKRDGSSLVQCPMAVPEIDAFRYRVNDADGFQCPAGAHVRRANPRDLLGWDVESGITASKLHRLIRRGRVWAKTDCANPGGANCGDKEHRDPDSDRRCGQGLVFIALNADLERQYEFIQQNWMMNRRFGNLSNEQDPILGNASPRRFTIPAIPVGKALAGADGLDNFTKVIGGGYFFLPGLAALGFIAAGPTPA